MAFVPELSSGTLLNLCSFLFWTFMYFWCREKFPEQSPEFYSRAVTLLHGSVATLVGLLQCDIGSLRPCAFTSEIFLPIYVICSFSYRKFNCYVPDVFRLSVLSVPFLRSGSEQYRMAVWMALHLCYIPFFTVAPIYAQHYALMVWSWGYFAFDLLWCLVFWTESALILIHHLCALLSITFYMKKAATGCTFACTLALMEVTNPLLQTRWFLRNFGFDKTKLFLFVEVAYIVSFFFARGVLGSYLLFRIITNHIFDMDQKMIGIVLYLISIALMWEIVSFVTYKYRHNIGKFKDFMDEMGIILNEQI